MAVDGRFGVYFSLISQANSDCPYSSDSRLIALLISFNFGVIRSICSLEEPCDNYSMMMQAVN